MKPTSKNTAMHFVDKITLPFTGIAGYSAWGGDAPVYQASASSPVTLPSYIHDKWKTTIRTKNHMNGEDVINTLSNTWGGWKHRLGKAEYKKTLRERYSVEHQYYTSSNKSSAVGYVRNRSYNVKTRGQYGSICYNEDFGVVNNSPRNTEWNDVKNNDRLRVNNLKTHTEYQIDWYSAFRENNNGYLKSDCIETNKEDGNWGITLEYPELTVSHTGNNDLPVVWYVIYQQNCNSGMIQQNYLEKTEEIIDRALLLKENRENRNVLNVHPNPFQNYILIQSPEKDFLTLKSIEGKVIGTYSIDKGTTEISTAYLSNGIYTLTFTNQGQTFKLIKQ